MDKRAHSILKSIAFIGSYLPRQCGIATFTTDLCETVAAEYAGTTCMALAVNDTNQGYAYPPRVRFELTEKDIESYRRAADFLNSNNVDLACLQFDYGIFGGSAGSYILSFLRELHIPIVTTLHTILNEPDAGQRQVLEEVTRLSERIVVMSERGANILQSIYCVPKEKIDLIPHGIPDVPFMDPSFHKDLFGMQGKSVLLSFGLLSANKGIENVISALPVILEKYPNVVYMVVGATHPHVIQKEGETYRLSLQWLAHEKDIEANVIFYNRFVTLEELVQFISAADIYITPYLDAAQITSGTLAYTLGAGKAVISTPYWYAEEMLAEERGALVPFNDPKRLADQVIDLLGNESKRHAMRKRAYLYGRDMVWSQVARRYMQSFDQAYEVWEARRQDTALTNITSQSFHRELPKLNLAHLRILTDDTGILQHATYTVPNYNEGYRTDDNARALIFSILLEETKKEFSTEACFLSTRYLAFLWYAFNSEEGHFRNILSYDRRWSEEIGSQDSHGRALWALGMVLGRSNHRGLPGIAGRLFSAALPAVLRFTSPRAWAFTLIGISEYMKRFADDRYARDVCENLLERLMALWRRYGTSEWPWFEDIVAYSNATLPQALILCGHQLQRADVLETGLKTLTWLKTIQTSKRGHFVPIGSNGFFRNNGTRTYYDQQPVETHAMLSACLEAYHATGDEHWRNEAWRIFEWFLGRNDLQLPLYDPSTGGCRDGLQPDRVNQNQGAESTLAFLLSLLEIEMQSESS
ncbi:MAG TPA: glycosyltransferase family 4 protein, partial [Anaerolineales bacterium]|nr:glycosyltransferase family 4 protein [Anaerolineales bacterium]